MDNGNIINEGNFEKLEKSVFILHKNHNINLHEKND